MRDKIAQLMMNKDNEMGECWCVWEDTSLDADATRASYRVTANHIFVLIRKEIKKVENPYTKEAGGDEHEIGFESCRQKLLALVEEG